MSLESLMLVAFLIVIPLLERLIRVLQARSLPRPADVAQVPVPSRPALPRPVPERAPSVFGPPERAELPGDIALPTLSSPPPLVARHPTAERLTSRQRAHAHQISPEAQVAPELVRRAPPPRRRRQTVKVDLRHSILMMTILGPCKARDYDRGRG